MSNNIKVIILLGAPGAGKGTVAQHLVDNFGMIHFSTGNLLRNEVKEETPTGKMVKSVLGSGGLVGDYIVNKVVESNLLKVLSDGRVILLDGFPRSVDQAKFLDMLCNATLKNALKVLEIDVNQEVVVSRIVGRRVCASCGATFGVHDKIEKCSRCGGELTKRSDDSEEVIRRRLREYVNVTLPVCRYYADRLVKVDGNTTPEEVLRNVDDVIHNFGL
jgi:adenylate kinase